MGREKSFPPANPALISRTHTQPLTRGLGQGEELQPVPWHVLGGISVKKPKAGSTFPSASVLGRDLG